MSCWAARALCGAFVLVSVAGCVRLHAKEDVAAPGRPLKGGADVHVHLTMRDSLFAFQGESEGPVVATSPDQYLVNQLPKDGLRRAGIRLIVATLWPPFALRPGRSALDEALGSMQALRTFVQKTPGYAIASSAADAERLMQRDLIAVLPHLEGAEAVTRVEDVDALYAAGYRSIGLVHFTDNALADAHDGQFGPLLSLLLDGEDGALTDLGRAAVARMMELGVLIDLSHASGRTREEVLRMAEAAQVPVLYSHAGADWGSPYTLDDDHARRIARLGGLIGIGIYRHDVLTPIPEPDQLSPHAHATCDDIIAIWRRYARIAGAQNVVLGSDLNSTIHRPRPGGRCPQGLRHAGDLPALFAALEAEGIGALDGADQRVLELFRAVEGSGDKRKPTP